jgi:acyl-CoA thioesterase
MKEDSIVSALRKRVSEEAYARNLGLEVVEVAPGRAVVQMSLREDMTNIFGRIHGGAIFSLIDEAFQLSCNAHGTVAVALSLTITYHQTPARTSILRAESSEIHCSRKTATYEIKVRDENGTLIASCQALAYRKKEPLPFLNPS